MSMRVVAVTATHRRPNELARLLGSLSGVECVVVCDNSASDDVRAVVEGAPIPAHLLTPETNLGCGGGLRLAEEHAWRIADGDFSHLLVLDDDTVLKPDTVPQLAEILDRERADAAYPLVLGPDGRVGWMPGLKDRALRRLDRERLMPEDFRRRFDVAVADFAWAQGICLLVRRAAVEAAGFHRADFWVRGEDLDFSLRLTARGRGVFAPAVEVKHLPPAPAASSNREAEFLRHAAMVQNIACLALTQRHGAPIRSSIAGASLRFVRMWGMRALPDLFRALWRGAQGEPAGAGIGRTFRQRFDELGAA
jgi:rhamnopyranosyl-N-acetylglucosaminyl-diphospho-decaprenol beta-1,3/1,4-galactofuranosyltransferase